MKISGTMAAVTLAACIGTGGAQNAGFVQRAASHEGMGFNQTTTTHDFYLTQTGGIIQVTAKDPRNTEQIATVQMHLKTHRGMFSAGDFSSPHFVHDRVPPGVPTMKRLRSSIRYTSESMDDGGRIRIATESPEAAIKRQMLVDDGRILAVAMRRLVSVADIL
jgi:hypothetical protein